MGPGMIYSRLRPWKTQRAQESSKFLYFSIPWFFRAIPGSFHPPLFLGPFHPCFCRLGMREGMKSFPALSGRLILPIPAPAPAAIPLLRPSQWILPARMGKESAKTSFNGIWGFFPMDPFPGSFCFQAEKVFEEVSDSSFYPKSKGSPGSSSPPVRKQRIPGSNSLLLNRRHRRHPDPASGRHRVLGKRFWKNWRMLKQGKGRFFPRLPSKGNPKPADLQGRHRSRRLHHKLNAAEGLPGYDRGKVGIHDPIPTDSSQAQLG